MKNTLLLQAELELLLFSKVAERGVSGKINLGINGVARAAKGAQLDTGVGEWGYVSRARPGQSVRAMGCLGQNQHVEIRLESRLILSPHCVRSNPTQKLQRPHCCAAWKVFEWQRAQGASQHPGKDIHKSTDRMICGSSSYL